MNVQSPLASAVVVPRDTPSAKTSTVLLASAVPLKLGVVSLVELSVSELPESDAAIRSGVEGMLGAWTSILALLTSSPNSRIETPP